MPEIPISSKLDPIVTWFTICGIMAFPDNVERQYQYKVLHITNLLVNTYGIERANKLMPPEYLGVLIESPGLTSIRKESEKRVAAGMVTGFSLLTLYRMSVVEKINNPSIEKLLYIINKFGGADKQNVFPASERGWRNYWNRFKPVAHLWAAQRICGFISGNNRQTDYDNISQYLATFISVSEHFRTFGISSKADMSKDFFIEECLTWCFPSDIEIKKFSVLPFKIDCKELFDNLLEDYSQRNVLVVRG